MAGSQTPGTDRSVARRAGAIVSGPSSVLLPPDGPSDPSIQLILDVAALRELRASVAVVLPGAGMAISREPEPFEAVMEAAHVVAAQLEPLRTHVTLLESYRREAVRTPAVRLAYAMVWLAIEAAGGRQRERRRAQRGRMRAGARKDLLTFK